MKVLYEFAYPCFVGSTDGRIRGLDGIRALAVSVVFLSHLPIALHRLGDGGWFQNFPHAGFLGVNLFFVMSGFLITHRILDSSSDDGRPALRAFWVRRAARILPAVGMFLAVHAVYAVFAGFPPDGSILDEVLMVVSTVFQFANYAILADINNLFDNGALWSLAVEGQFYIVWPFVVWFLSRKVRRGTTVAVILAAVIVLLSRHRAIVFDSFGSYDTYLRTDTRIESLLIGSVGAVAWMRTSLVPARLLGRLTVPALVAMVAIFLNATQWSAFIWHWGMTLFDICALVIVLALATGTCPLRRALEMRPVAWVGMVSYGLYIWQVPVLHVLLRHGESLGDIVQGIIAVAVTVSLAAGSWYLVESPIRHSRLVARLSGN